MTEVHLPSFRVMFLLGEQRKFPLKVLGINTEEGDIVQQFDYYGPPYTVSGISV